MNFNNFLANAAEGLRVDTASYSGALDATCNWWGDPSGPTVATNPSGMGDDIFDADATHVTFVPWLSTAIPNPCSGPVHLDIGSDSIIDVNFGIVTLGDVAGEFQDGVHSGVGDRERPVVADQAIARHQAAPRHEAPVGEPVAAYVQDDHPAPETDFSQPREIFAARAIAGRVLRVAQNQGIGVTTDAPFEIFEIDGISPVGVFHQTLFRLQVAVSEVPVKPVVSGSRQEDFASRRREGLQCGNDAWVDARGDPEQIRIDLDTVASFVPTDDAIGKRPRHVQVAPVLVLDALLQGLGDDRGAFEIHIRDAHARDDVIHSVCSNH